MDTRPDRITLATLHGAASRLAGWQARQDPERQAAVEELRQISGGRTGLLTELAGVLLGYHPEGRPAHEHARIMADLLIDAGADVNDLQRWQREGAKRRALPLSSG